MSDSDDTDVLLLIPPDLFVVPSSDSEDQSLSVARRTLPRRRQGGVVSQILEHVQTLENRISVIESRDNSLEVPSLLNASLDSNLPAARYPSHESSPVGKKSHGRAYTTVSRYSGPPDAPVEPRLRRSSSRSSPGRSLASSLPNAPRGEESRSKRRSSFDDTDRHCSSVTREGGDCSVSGERKNVPASRHGRECSSDERGRDACEMELSEVDELLQEMEATEIELARRIDSSNARRGAEEPERFESTGRGTRGLELRFAEEDLGGREEASSRAGRDAGNLERRADVSLPEDASPRTEDHSTRPRDFGVRESLENVDRAKSYIGDERPDDRRDSAVKAETGGGPEETTVARVVADPFQLGERVVSQSFKTLHVDDRVAGSSNHRCLPGAATSGATQQQPAGEAEESDAHTQDGGNDTENGGVPGNGLSRCTDELQRTVREIRTMGYRGSNSSIRKTNDACPTKTQRLLALSDFWDCDGTKSQEEMLRIRLEEEKFRREHCEHLIQELQKRLLEQQEKVAVAIRVDNEKNAAISQFQEAWSKLRQRWETLEKDHKELESKLTNLTDSRNSEVADYQRQMKRGEGELSKALDLAAGYKEKADQLVKEKLELLASHADELEKYKILVQEAEQRYELLRDDRNKLFDMKKQLEERVDQAQQELNKERSRSTEVRTEMAVIHKALDACEAELTILRQEKDNLQLKIKEETTRNGILEQSKIALVETANEAKNGEKAAKEEAKLLVERQEQIRSELREIYQKQLDDVVKAKLKEFQGQLDAAELAFQTDLETRQRAIAECAARKIKSIIDKHQLEINLLEEKHHEEKRLSEIQLAQASQKVVMLEVQLNAQRAGKTHLAEQLHSVMQKQWQQALHIISGGQMENLSPLQRLNAERIIEGRSSKRCSSACCNNKDRRSHRPEFRFASGSRNLLNPSSRQHEQDESLVTLTSNDETPLSRKESKEDLRKYIKMILDMQQPNKDEFARAKYQEESNPSPPPVTREVPRKHYTKRESNGALSEESVTWQRVDDKSMNETCEYTQIPQSQGSQGSRVEQPKSKPPWK